MLNLSLQFEENVVEDFIFKIYVAHTDYEKGQLIVKTFKQQNKMIAGRHLVALFKTPGQLMKLSTNNPCAIIIDGALLKNFNFLAKVVKNNRRSSCYIICEDEKQHKPYFQYYATSIFKSLGKLETCAIINEVDELYTKINLETIG